MDDREKKKFKKLWDFFDGHIRCINLLSREDRYEESQLLFKKYNIPVRYYRTRKNISAQRGCFESHIKVIKEAYVSGAERVLIFEDDITSSAYLTSENLERAGSRLRLFDCR